MIMMGKSILQIWVNICNGKSETWIYDKKFSAIEVDKAPAKLVTKVSIKVTGTWSRCMPGFMLAAIKAYNRTLVSNLT